jgi:hypothetical protein
LAAFASISSILVHKKAQDMSQQSKAKSGCFKWFLVLLCLIIVIGAVVFRIAFNRPSFDADKVAQAETEMWRAYYGEDRTQLGLTLITLLRSQHGLSLVEAKNIGQLFARSAMEFQSTKSGYEKTVLPYLTEAYGRIQQASGASFDHKEAARAELAWWVARRTPGQDSTEQVGAKITELYVILYGGDHPSFHKAGLLRAQAAAVRDSGEASADWGRVEELLRESYREVGKGI